MTESIKKLDLANRSDSSEASSDSKSFDASVIMFGLEDVPLAEFMYLVFTRMPGEHYSRRLRSLLLYLCYVFRALINSLVLGVRVTQSESTLSLSLKAKVLNRIEYGHHLDG